jgi:spore coat protein H
MIKRFPGFPGQRNSMSRAANLRPAATDWCWVLFGCLALFSGCDRGTGVAPKDDAAPKTQAKSPASVPKIAAPKPSTSDESTSETTKPQVTKPEATKPKSASRSAAMALLDASTSSLPEAPVKNEPVKESESGVVSEADINRAAAQAVERRTARTPVPVTTGAMKSEPVKTAPMKTEIAMAERVKPEPVKAKPAKTEAGTAGPVSAEPGKASTDKADSGKKVDPSDEFFAKGMIPEIRITLTEKEEAQLRRDLRRYVDVTFTENGTTTYKKAKMKLKGAAGSFRDLNDRPALTFATRAKGERFHGMEKFHLNNSVQDESYLNELIASELCHDAGVPAARATHARVWLNNRDLGFYVLKEGMTEKFVKRHFKNAKGNFYDGAFCADIDAPLEKEFGDGPDDRSDLKQLIDACREGDQAKRWKLIEEKVAIDEFINFVAMELLMCHWDGYCQNKNNYRIYFPADDKKVRFLPHGMDQMFGDINFSVFHVPGPMVANVVMQNPAVQARYRQRVRELLPLFAPDKLNAKIEAAHVRIRPVLAKIHEDRAKQFDSRVTDYKNRVAGRLQAVKAQFPPEPIAFNADGWALTEDWVAKPQGDAKLESLNKDGKAVLSLVPGPSNQVQASFRTKVRLARGSYRFDAKVKTDGVVAAPDDKGYGAGVRLGGSMRKNNIIGTTDWQTVSHEFEAGQDLQEIELVAELKSTAGSALFDLASLRVYKLK